jgi:hypothetical protein
MEKWTILDSASGYCTNKVVGSTKHYVPLDPLENVWTNADVKAGRCTKDEVLSPRHPPFQRQVPPEDYIPPSYDDEIVNLTDPKVQQELFNHMGGMANFKKWAANNRETVYPLIMKMGLTQLAKAAPELPPDLNAIPDADLENMSSLELKRLLLARTTSNEPGT